MFGEQWHSMVVLTSPTSCSSLGLRLDIGYALRAVLDALHDTALGHILSGRSSATSHSCARQASLGEAYVTAADLGVFVEIVACIFGTAARAEHKLRGWDVKGFL